MLKAATVPILADADCSDPDLYGNLFQARSMLCAGDVDGGDNSCFGDSGGPLSVSDGASARLLVGIVSWGGDCDLSPGVYARAAGGGLCSTIASATAQIEATEGIPAEFREAVVSGSCPPVPPVPPPPANDDLADAQIFGSGATAAATGTNFDATAEPGEPMHDGLPGGASVWYRWQAPSAGTTTIQTCGSDFDSLLAVYGGGVSGVGSLGTAVASNDDDPTFACDLASRVSFHATAGQTYRIAVDGLAASRAMSPCP
jgi:hypothetical protein